MTAQSTAEATAQSTAEATAQSTAESTAQPTGQVSVREGAVRLLRVGVLISGRGSNLQALIAAADDPAFGAQIAVVISSSPAAAGLDHARCRDIPAIGLTAPRRAAGEAAGLAFEADVSRLLREHAIDLVCLAGFMRLLSAGFVEAWRDRLINIHPSLLPAFKGLHVHERVLDSGVRVTGCTVHYVRAAMDEGPILVQAAVPVLPDDDPDRLSLRVLAAEHRAYPLAVRLIARNEVHVDGERVVWTPTGAPASHADLLLNPKDSPD